MLKKLKKNIIVAVVLSAIILLLFSIFADYSSVLNSLSNFNLLLIPVLLLLSLGNYLVRFYKWHYYLGCLDIKIPMLLSLKIFFSGLSMSASPGKVGEVLKSFLLKEVKAEPVSKTAPIIFAERVTDFLSLTFITIILGIYFNYSGVIAYVVLLFFVAIIVFIGNKKSAESVIHFFSKSPFIKQHLQKITALYESSYLLLKPKPLMLMFFVSVFSWMFECFGFYLILINFGGGINILLPAFVFAFSITVGAVSMLPGGIGVTEGSLSLMLINYGIAKETAVASTIIIRVVTLWFALILGILVLLSMNKEINKSKVK